MQKNKKKIILSIIILIIIITVIIILVPKKEEIKTIKNTNEDKLAIILEHTNGNVESNTFPADNDTYYFNKLTCENITDTSKIYKWDEENWKLNLTASSTTNVDGAFKCSIYFKPVVPTSTYTVNSTANPYHTFTVPETATYKIEL